ncbi:MAG: tetratricopeptide repeat protein [Lachnospiraceae bacterium]|jgi:tetratricopeptide (TPR) repeat protein|nr:tetratricopeptide repeat protein [Lachnospiraceae bacterium]
MLKKAFGSVLICVFIIVGGACSLPGGDRHIAAGMEALTGQDFDGALLAFRAAAEAGENPRQLHRGMGIALMGLLRYDEALASFANALSYSSGLPDRTDFDINYYMATAYFLTGRPERAIEIYDAILALRDDESDAFYLRGAIKVSEGRIEDARSDFDMAIALYDGGSDRLIDIYQILEGGGYRQLGEEYLRRATEGDAHNELDNFERGRIAFHLGDFENARMYLERARGTSYEAVLYLGKTYEVLGDFNYAVSVYSSYLDDGNESPHIFNQLGICRFRMHEYEAALTAFVGGMAIENNDILRVLRFNEIVTNQFLGDFRRAAVLLDGYLRDYPNDHVAVRENYFLRTR